MSVLSSSVVAAIDDLELVARLVVEGARSGGHRSPFHGFAAEFADRTHQRAGIGGDWLLLAGDVRADDPADVRPPLDFMKDIGRHTSLGGLVWIFGL